LIREGGEVDHGAAYARADDGVALRTVRENMGKALTAAGGVIVLASLVVGIWLQFEITIQRPAPEHFTAQVRLSLVMEMLTPLAVGLVLIAAGRLVELLEARQAVRVDAAPTELTDASSSN
jgi:hypothetical protein